MFARMVCLCIAIDEFGNKWIGNTAEFDVNQCLIKFNDTVCTRYDTANSDLPDSHIKCIVIDASGNKWIATGYGGLVKFDGSIWTVYNEPDPDLSYDYIHSIAIDELGNKWIGTSGGLTVFNEGGIVPVEEETDGLNRIPTNYVLHQNYPNPFNPATTIKYSFED